MIFKSYKKLYKIEHENNIKLIKQNSELSKERVEAKQETARVKIELEDALGFLRQETEAKETLKKERTKLRKMITELGGNWKDGK